MSPATAVMLGLVVAAPVAAPLPDTPVAVDVEILGEWNCGDTAITITALGITLEGEVARTGTPEGAAGRLVIRWDDGVTSEWAYAAGGGTLILATDRGANYACLARK